MFGIGSFKNTARGGALLIAGAAALGLAPIAAAAPASAPMTIPMPAAPCTAFQHNHVGVPGVVDPGVTECNQVPAQVRTQHSVTVIPAEPAAVADEAAGHAG